MIWVFLGRNKKPNRLQQAVWFFEDGNIQPSVFLR
jgi:hypothetical protein